MKLTKLEILIMEHRLEVPDAMAECLADSTDITYDKAHDYVMQYTPDLIRKMESDIELNDIEKELILDIATLTVYSDMADDAIGDKWDDREMTASWASRIFNTECSLKKKLLGITGMSEYIKANGMEEYV